MKKFIVNRDWKRDFPRCFFFLLPGINEGGQEFFWENLVDNITSKLPQYSSESLRKIFLLEIDQDTKPKKLLEKFYCKIREIVLPDEPPEQFSMEEEYWQESEKLISPLLKEKDGLFFLYKFKEEAPPVEFLQKIEDFWLQFPLESLKQPVWIGIHWPTKEDNPKDMLQIWDQLKMWENNSLQKVLFPQFERFKIEDIESFLEDLAYEHHEFFKSNPLDFDKKRKIKNNLGGDYSPPNTYKALREELPAKP